MFSLEYNEAVKAVTLGNEKGEEEDENAEDAESEDDEEIDRYRGPAQKFRSGKVMQLADYSD